MSRQQRHDQICAACGIKNQMYSLVWVVDKQATGLPNVECRACLASMRGGPDKIMIHNDNDYYEYDSDNDYYCDACDYNHYQHILIYPGKITQN